MATGEARSGSGQNMWSVLAQGLAAGASAIPGALAKERENKLKALGAIFDAQNMIMQKQQHEQTMTLNMAKLNQVNQETALAVKKLTSFHTPEEELQDKMSALGKLTTQYPNAAVNVEGVMVDPESVPNPPQKSWQNRLMDLMGPDAFMDWYKKDKDEKKGADPQLIARHQEYLSQLADKNLTMSFTNPDAVPEPALSYGEWIKQYNGEVAPIPADLEPAVELEDEDARLQELLDLISK